MGDRFIMSEKELRRKAILEGVKEGRITLTLAAKKLELSYRQAQRVYKRYLEEGNGGLIHKSRGKPPSTAISNEYRKSILDLYREKYIGFGPTLASEKLLEDDGLYIHPETLRKWLLKENLFVRQRKRKPYRKMRERREAFGELLQIDGSIHNWFSDDRKNTCLLNMVDDATGTTLAILDTGETTQVLLLTLKKWIKLYGIPNAVYVDLKSVYVSPVGLRTACIEDKVNFSVFERVCEKLGITIIKAYSAQAKGRVERNHRVYQDRLVKELHLYNIKEIELANQFLDQKYIPKINGKFAEEINKVPNMHRDPAAYGNLDEILCWEYPRTLKNNWTVPLNNEHYQIKSSAVNIVQPEDKILIKKYLSGEIKIWFKNIELEYEKLKAKKEPMSRTEEYKSKRRVLAANRRFKPRKKVSPAQDHPWRRWNNTGKEKKVSHST